MNHTRLGLLGLCVFVFGTMAMSTNSAQAALSWLILNSAGTTATELKATLVGETDSAHLILLAKSQGLPIIFTCTSFELKNVSLAVGGKLNEGGKVVFKGCEAYKEESLTGPLVCHVHTTGSFEGTIETNELKGELVLHELIGGGKEVLAKVEPKTAGGAFATILTEKCSLPESNKISGVLYLKDVLGRATTHEVRHLVAQGPLTSLLYGTHTPEHLETSLDGSGWIKLGEPHKGLLWSAMDV